MALRLNALEYLEETAARLPDKPAFVDRDGQFTFGGLLEASRSIGTAVAGTVVQTCRPIVVLTDRTTISIAGFMGALQAGCFYVPVDVKMPRERLQNILETLDPGALVYAAKDAKAAEPFRDFVPALELETAMASEPDPALLSAARACVLDIDPAYVLFTSGSTGTPKGILISHRSLIDFTEWMAEACGITEEDVLGNQAPFYFDTSVKDIYTSLRCGATVHILPRTLFMFPKLLIDYLGEHRVTALNWATSAFRLVATSGVLEANAPTSVKKVILGGEALQAVHLNAWRRAMPDVQYINCYGPTEVTVDCTWYPIEREFEDGEAIPIGKPCRNMDVLLLDDDLRPVPQGEAGEICVRGSGLAIGYYGDPEKTAAAFVQNPLRPDYPDRLYRTGDIARMDGDGNLIFLSRRDGQIKHMGYRIELGDVETAVTAIPGVDAAACIFDRDADKIVCFCQTALGADALAAEAKLRLQKYMTPNVWRTMARLPLNPNGKLDRVRLKEAYFAEDRKL